MIQPARYNESNGSTPSSDGDSALEDLIEDCTNRLQAGESIDLDDLVALHPEHAERLRRLLPSLRMMAEVGGTAHGMLPAVLPAGGALGPPPAGPFELGDYRILRMIGRGGMGVVYEATQLSLNRRVALKVLPFAAALDPHQLRRFQIEAQAAAQLHHTSIVPVFSVGCERGVHFYAMQFIEGRTVAALIQDRREASRPDAGPARPSADREYIRSVARLGIQAAEALDHAHRQGIIHRDIKPANLLVDARGGLWITDFGLARFVNEAGLTMTGDLIGTLRYMSPEQALAKRLVLDHRTDIYSLGATLYELLTLRPVVEGRDRQEVLGRIARDEPVAPRRIDPTIPRDLETILLKSLAREPEERYATAQELADDLRRFLEHRPIRARRPSVVERATKWLRRHPALVGSAVMTLALAVIGLAVGTVWTNRALREALWQRDEARARGLVGALVVAETRSVPEILHQLAPDRSLVRDQLRALVAAIEPSRDPVRRRLHAAMALLPDDPTQLECLASHSLREDTHPDEVLVIGQVIREQHHAAPMISRLQSELSAGTSALTDTQLRAAATLALLDPAAPEWADLAPKVATRLVRENPLLLPTWREIFQPVCQILNGPLRAVYDDRTAAEEQRSLAFALLFGFADRAENSRRDEDLADLFGEADPVKFHRIEQAIGDRPKARVHLASLLRASPSTGDAIGRWRGRIATALIALGDPERGWSLLREEETPDARTELIHDLELYGVAPEVLIDRLDREPIPAGRRALLLALGGYPPGQFTDRRRERLLSTLFDLYRADADPGTHGAVDWLLRRWGYGDRLATIARELASRGPSANRDWYVNRQGQTFSIIRGPRRVLVGSPEDEPGRDNDEFRHLVEIPRSFAIASREVTIAEFRRLAGVDHRFRWAFRDDEARTYTTSRDCPAVLMTWLMAARYCNLLSRAEGLPESEWCYPETLDGDADEGRGLALSLNLSVEQLKRKGYRLPTEAEWEYACRAGSLTARPIGASPANLAEYAWFLDNAGNALHPVGLLKPNDLGLFDMLGNASEWVQDRYVRHHTGIVDRSVLERDVRIATLDGERNSEELEAMNSVRCRNMKGGSFHDIPLRLRPAFRNCTMEARFSLGFRPARTVD